MSTFKHISKQKLIRLSYEIGFQYLRRIILVLIVTMSGHHMREINEYMIDH